MSNFSDRDYDEHSLNSGGSVPYVKDCTHEDAGHGTGQSIDASLYVDEQLAAGQNEEQDLSQLEVSNLETDHNMGNSVSNSANARGGALWAPRGASWALRRARRRALGA